jgi:tetratricopeptide (TPR) repeat protein
MKAQFFINKNDQNNIVMEQSLDLCYYLLNKFNNNYNCLTLRIMNVYRLYILGALRLESPQGENITPRGPKAQALLGMLATSDRRERSKNWLCDKLYPALDLTAAKTNLRGLLRDLHKHTLWGKHFSQILQSSHTTLSLSPNLYCDLSTLLKSKTPSEYINQHNLHDCQLLEGLNISHQYNDDFDPLEEWLRDERSRLEVFIDQRAIAVEEPISDRHTDQVIQQKDIPPNSSDECKVLSEPLLLLPSNQTKIDSLERAFLTKNRNDKNLSGNKSFKAIDLIILPAIVFGSNKDLVIGLSDVILDQIIRNLGEWISIRVFDYRSHGETYELKDSENNLFQLRLRVNVDNDNVALNLLTYKNGLTDGLLTDPLITTKADLLNPKNSKVINFININSDRLAEKLIRLLGTNQHYIDNALGILIQLFHFRLKDQNSTQKLLLELHSHDRSGLSIGVGAYINTFVQGENIDHTDLGSNQLHEIIRKSISSNINNSVSLTCLAHVTAYSLHDYVLAEQLFEKAMSVNPKQAFVLDHYALFQLYLGKPDLAIKYSDRAIYYGQFSPLKFTYYTTMAMCLTQLGKYEEAISFCQKSIAMQPRYLAPRRYLAMVYGLIENKVKAIEQVKIIISLDPNFQQSESLFKSFGTSNNQVIEMIKRTFTKELFQSVSDQSKF